MTVPVFTSRAKPRRLGKVVAVVLILGVCGAAVWYWGIHEPEPKDDLSRFQGDWKMTIGGRDEKEEEDGLPQVAVRIVSHGRHVAQLVGHRGQVADRIEQVSAVVAVGVGGLVRGMG